MTARRNDYQVQVLVAGEPLKVLTDQEQQSWVQADNGQEWTLRVHVPAAGRQLVVASVDGLSVMDGKPSSGRGTGYVVSSGQRYIDIPGYRLDNSAVAKFYFSEGGQSYAAQMGHSDNLGIIGVNIFEEDVPPRPRPFRLPSLGSSGGSERSMTRGLDRDMGTGFGGRNEHRVNEVRFRAQPRPVATLVVNYASEARLIEAGIKRPMMKPSAPFPEGQEPETGCTPPENWRG